MSDTPEDITLNDPASTALDIEDVAEADETFRIGGDAQADEVPQGGQVENLNAGDAPEELPPSTVDAIGQGPTDRVVVQVEQEEPVIAPAEDGGSDRSVEAPLEDAGAMPVDEALEAATVPIEGQTPAEPEELGAPESEVVAAVEEAAVDDAAASEESAREEAAVEEPAPTEAPVAEVEAAPKTKTRAKAKAAETARAATAEDEEPAPASNDPFRGPGDWYVVHTYAGYENKVKANLESRIHTMQMEDKIFHVHIPMEDVMEIKGGKKQVVQRKVFPGYLLVKMEYDNDSWYVVRNTPGVTGFVAAGTGSKPTPLSRREVEKILVVKKEEVKPQFRLGFEEGDVVRIISGPFADFNGTISEINVDQSKLKVLVNIFDRETPVELGFDQVAKV
jgi:transcription termination/antitermination protein NusG